MGLSVVIPTYKNTNFLSELFDSIEKNNFDGELEVLIGIDNCIESLEFILKRNNFPTYFSFYFFLENVGPYIIKNSLSQESKFDKILFFDSDDILQPNMFHYINYYLDRYDLVKPKYQNFEDKDGQRVFQESKGTFGEGVFGIKKDLFDSVNGFEGWKCAADSDLMGRLYKKTHSLVHTPHILFYRRLHTQSLTIHPETGYKSKLRSQYYLISKKKTDEDIVLSEMKISTYEIVNFNRNYDQYPPGQPFMDEVQIEIQTKEEKQNKLKELLKTNEVKYFLQKDKKTIDYKNLNYKTVHQSKSNVNTALKKAKLENLGRKYR